MTDDWKKNTLNAFVLDKSLQGFDHLDLSIPFLINFFFFSRLFFIYIYMYIYTYIYIYIGEGNGNPLQYSCLENSMNREAWLQYSCLEDSMDRDFWWATVHGVTKSWTQLSDSHTHTHTHTHTYTIFSFLALLDRHCLVQSFSNE